MSQAAELAQGRAEVVKLARMLGREPDQLAYLEQLSPAELRELREGVTEVLYDYDDTVATRLVQRLESLPARRRRQAAQRARQSGALDRLGELGQALSAT